ncbi:hypothetical protein MSSAC_2501 [Methanosarcina siciliae C2J]|uniref:Uncharacterized protein n=1 Tax=Methanosarcina siciliae C2J TaxID=1434118 RepID=A0A0E3LDD7_9EURY|nr:hypothetical protein [Methanosarcina siciliae]AKB37091.1 hypothetical protein MSSAC_2501 [Methanosarcina siciliae C2J]
MVIKAPTKIKNPLFKEELKYIPLEGVKSVEESKDAEIREKLKGSVVEVGKPEPYNLKQMCVIQGIEPPVKMQILFEKYDFWLIEAPFAFLPALNTHFEQARILARLESLSDDVEDPIVHDMYPDNISEEKKEKHRISIGLSLKFAEIIEPKVQYVDEIEFTRLYPIIEIAGIGKSESIWAFSEEALSNLKNVNTLYTVVKVPHGTKGINVRFYLYAEAPTKWGLKLLGIEKDEKYEKYEIPFSNA